MIIETGRVVSVEAEGLWVETIRKTTCGSCKAQKGCGQGLLNQWDGHTSYIWVLLDGRDHVDYSLGDEIHIGVPEELVAKGSLMVYMVPVVSLVVTTAVAHTQFSNEAITTLSGFAGLLLGGLVVRWHSWRNRHNRSMQPVLIDDSKPLNFHSLEETHLHAANQR